MSSPLSLQQSVGALALLYGATAARMSAFRLAGSPGEDKVNSPLNRCWEANQLTAEWVGIGSALILAVGQKQLSGGELAAAELAAFVFVAARWAFCARYWLPRSLSFAIGVPSMVTCYGAFFFLVRTALFA